MDSIIKNIIKYVIANTIILFENKITEKDETHKVKVFINDNDIEKENYHLSERL